MTSPPRLSVAKNTDFQTLQSQHCALSDIKPFALMPAKIAGPVVISAPHGGTSYPHDLYALDEERLQRFRSLEDSGTALIAALLHSTQRPILSAPMGRAIIDLNRPATALDPLLFETKIETLPSHDPYSPYIAAGYGVIPRLCGNRKALHKTSLCFERCQSLIKHYHAPYHDKVAALLRDAGNEAILIDIHSMPPRSAGKNLPDFIFGDDFGTTMPAELRPLITQIMAQTPYSHGWNHPYAGGYITKKYGGRPSPHHALQIEINRNLYTGSNWRISHGAIADIASLLNNIINGIEAYHAALLAAQ